MREVINQQPPLEVQRRLRSLLKRLDEAPSLHDARIARAIRVLETQDTAAAREVLQQWAAGTPGLRLTDGARMALARNKAR